MIKNALTTKQLQAIVTIIFLLQLIICSQTLAGPILTPQNPLYPYTTLSQTKSALTERSHQTKKNNATKQQQSDKVKEGFTQSWWLKLPLLSLLIFILWRRLRQPPVVYKA